MDFGKKPTEREDLFPTTTKVCALQQRLQSLASERFSFATTPIFEPGVDLARGADHRPPYSSYLRFCWIGCRFSWLGRSAFLVRIIDPSLFVGKKEGVELDQNFNFTVCSASAKTRHNA